MNELRVLPVIAEDGQPIYRLPPHSLIPRERDTFYSFVTFSDKFPLRIVTSWVTADVPRVDAVFGHGRLQL